MKIQKTLYNFILKKHVNVKKILFYVKSLKKKENKNK